MLIRELELPKDADGMLQCITQLQDYEREIVPSMPTGTSLCKSYLSEMMRDVDKFAGIVLVAVDDEQVVGFITIHTRMISDDASDGDMEFGFISDLCVRDGYRDQGLGRQLLRRAESCAVDNQVKLLRIGVLTENTRAAGLYQSLGFKPVSMQLEKTL